MVYTAVHAGFYFTLYYIICSTIRTQHRGTLPITIYYYNIIHTAIIWARIKGVREHNILPATRHELRVPAESWSCVFRLIAYHGIWYYIAVGHNRYIIYCRVQTLHETVIGLVTLLRSRTSRMREKKIKWKITSPIICIPPILSAWS